MEENVEQTEKENRLQKNEMKPIEKLIKTKILGIVLIIFTALWTFLSIYEFLTFGTEITSFHLPIAVLSYIVGIVLLMVKNKGLYHKLLVIVGIILLTFYVYIVILLRIVG